MTYVLTDLPFLTEEMELAKERAAQTARDNYHKDRYSNRHQREVERLDKLIGLIQQPVTVEPYSNGCVLLNKEYVVSLSNNNWRVRGKNKWYKHKNDLSHFVNKYVLKDEKNETNT